VMFLKGRFRLQFVRVTPRIPDPDQHPHFEMKLRYNPRIPETVSGGYPSNSGSGNCTEMGSSRVDNFWILRSATIFALLGGGSMRLLSTGGLWLRFFDIFIYFT
jgi:hypothetical protein